MSLFCVNECKFNSCGLHFATMYDLIQHIEETHIDVESDAFKKQHESTPNCIPISYLCRVFPQLPAEKAKPITPEPSVLPTPVHQKRRVSNVNVTAISALNFHPQPPANRTVNSSGGFTDVSSNADNETINVSESLGGGLSVSDLGSPMDESSSGSPYGLKLGNLSSDEKRYACPVQGCNKRYKNINGVRMHVKTQHSSLETSVERPDRPYKCTICGKRYKTTHGLQNHAAGAHNKTSTGLSVSTPGSSATLGAPTPSALAGALSTPPLPTPPTGRNPPVTLISAPPSKGTTTIHVSPAPSPGSATIAAAVAGGHQYHQSSGSSSGYGSYHSPHVRISGSTSGTSGSNVALVPIVGRSPPVKKFTRHPPQARSGQVHGFYVHSGTTNQSSNQSSGSTNAMDTSDVKSERN